VIMTNLAHMAAFGFLISASNQNSWVSSILSAKPLVGVGAISYGMYLWHYPAALYFRELYPWYQTGPLVLGFSIAMATVSYLVLEKPLQRYRRSLGYQHRVEERLMSARDDRAPQTAIVTAAA